MLKVVKFGGSSLAGADKFRQVRTIIEKDPARRVVVVSAPGKRFGEDHKITDLLYLCYAHVQYGVSCENVFSMIRQRFTDLKEELGLHVNVEADLDAIRQKIGEGISQDELVSRGEYLSARLMADYLGYDFVDAADWLCFSLDGSVDQEVSYERLRMLAGDRRVVIPGFYGIMPDGQIHTLSRGGSDVTGALAAAALEADVYENWTDVSGILMADPRIVENPRCIARLTYSELRELSYIGAQVLHESSVFPVREKGIPLNIRNTDAPEDPGTMIREAFPAEEEVSGQLITGTAGKKGFTIITVTKQGMSSAVGAFRQILNGFAKYEIPVAYTVGGIDCYSCIVEDQKLSARKYAVLSDIEKNLEPDEIRLTEHIAVLAVVGRRMAFRQGSSARIFRALGESGVNVRMISQGPEELNIIIGVEEKDYAPAVRALYSICV